MKDAYPDLSDKESFIRKVIVNEEQRFIETLDSGLKILSEEVATLKKSGQPIVPGEVVFKLYDTFGFPVDLTADIVKKDRLTLDMEGFEKPWKRNVKKPVNPGREAESRPLRTVIKNLPSEGFPRNSLASMALPRPRPALPPF